MIDKNSLKISTTLFEFINNEAIPGTDVNVDNFWKKFSDVVHELAPTNKKLIEKRENIQKKIDNWHISNKGKEFDKIKYIDFLKSIGYLVDEGNDFNIATENVDIEISSIAGPQLVVPVDNARYALNAANARWGSLYNALYGTDVIPGKLGSNWDQERAKKVINFVKDFLDERFPLQQSKWKDVSKIEVEAEKLILFCGSKRDFLKNNEQFIGYNGSKETLKSILIRNNNLHIDIIIDANSEVGTLDNASISDVIVESALSTIVDNEDSVAAVDAEDKVKCYRNWLGLMKGNLKVQFEKNGKNLERKLNPDRSYVSKNGIGKKLHGRSLLLIRNVGHLMTNSAILLKDGSEIPEGLMDAFITTAAALHDLKNKKNSRTGSVYIVKPKMHGPDETAFTDLIFTKVEEVLGIKKYTCKIGIMDEERRTSANLKECIRTLQNRVFFINTGFLDRTGDEMHTSMEAGPMIKKGDMKSSKWIMAYENNNVDIGLRCGFFGKAQIGKGMWAMPDKMRDMMEQKISHLKAGANCAWVPSPTAASLHALHYHKIDIFSEQKKILKREKAKLDDLLTIPIANRPNWSVNEINSEISNSAQTILGYVVRWIDQGVGCSKVPDINNVGLMEDRATLRISSQQITNWLYHGICSRKQVLETMKKMAKIVDKQNINDKFYQKMSPYYDRSIAFKTACELVFQGKDQPSGYTEPLLHLNRLIKKN